MTVEHKQHNCFIGYVARFRNQLKEMSEAHSPTDAALVEVQAIIPHLEKLDRELRKGRRK